MSIVPFLIMAKNQEKKLHSNKSNKSNKSDNDHSYSSSGGHYTIENYVYSLFVRDNVAKSFFTKLHEAGEKIDELDKKECLDGFVELSNKYFSLVEIVKGAMDELKEEGLNLSGKFRTKVHCYPVKVEHGFGFHGMDIGYNKGAPFGCCFNGVRITEKMLLNDDVNVYEEEFKDWELQNSNIHFEEKWLEDVIAKKKQKLKLLIFNRSEKEQEIKKLEKQLDEIKVKIEEGRQIKKCAKFFDSLTSSQKAKMLSYFKYVNECEKIGKKIEELIDKAISIKNVYSFNKSDKWNRAFNMLLESNDASFREEMEYVNNLILQAREQELVVGLKESSIVGPYSFVQLLNWYIEKVIFVDNPKDIEEINGKSKKR